MSKKSVNLTVLRWLDGKEVSFQRRGLCITVMFNLFVAILRRYRAKMSLKMEKEISVSITFLGIKGT